MNGQTIPCGVDGNCKSKNDLGATDSPVLTDGLFDRRTLLFASLIVPVVRNVRQFDGDDAGRKCDRIVAERVALTDAPYAAGIGVVCRDRCLSQCAGRR